MKEQARRAPLNENTELELVADLFYRQYDILYHLTTQMLATKSLDDKISLVLDAVTSELGYAHAALALIDPDTGEMRMRLAIGFPGDGAAGRMVVPANFGSPFGPASPGSRPAWIRRGRSKPENDFLNEIGAETDLLALPLFGDQWLAASPDDNRRPWDAELAADKSRCIGTLYIACSPDASAAALNLLLRLADRVGLTIALAEQNERLKQTISRLEREREWVNAITQSVADPIVLTNLDNQILLQNKRAEELFSGSEEEDSSEGKLRALKMNELLDETLVLVDKKMRQAGTRIVREFENELPGIHARADQLRQVFLNLLLNAQQSIQGRGKITIKTTAVESSLEGWISIEISDTGMGISDEDLTRIFEPFFSTRKKGTGLGLWVTQDIVRHHGGRIEVTSIVNRGTTFRIVLPIEPPPSAQQSNPTAALSA